MDGSWAWLPILQRLRVFSYFSSLTNLFMWSAQHFICYNVKEFIPLYLDKFNNFDSRRSWVITSKYQTHSTVLMSQCTTQTFYYYSNPEHTTFYYYPKLEQTTFYFYPNPNSFPFHLWETFENLKFKYNESY